jgi:hypothetical protein
MAACSAKFASCRTSVAALGGFAYSHIIEQCTTWSSAMNFGLTLKTLVVLALVAAATAVIVDSEHGAATMPLQHQNVLN